MPRKSTKHLALRGLLAERGMLVSELAEAIHTSPQNLSSKLNGVTRWMWEDVLKICDVLDIQPCDMRRYFPQPAHLKGA